MGRLKDTLIDLEGQGKLIFNESRGEYISPRRQALLDEIEYLKWKIWSLQEDLEQKEAEFDSTYDQDTTSILQHAVNMKQLAEKINGRG